MYVLLSRYCTEECWYTDCLQKLYVRTVRQIRRIDSVKRSPIFVHFDESVTGSSSIKAYNRVEEFTQKCDRLTDESQRAWYHVVMSMRYACVTAGCSTVDE